MKLLNSLLEIALEFGRKFAQLGILAQTAAAVVLVFGFYQLSSCNKDTTMDSIKIAAEQTNQHVRHMTDSLAALSDSVAKKEIIIKRLTVEISMRSRASTKLKTDQRRLETIRDTVTDTVTIVAVQDTVIDNLKTQVAIADTIISKKDEVIVQKDTIIGTLKTSLLLSESKADTLEKTLEYTINKAKKKDKVFGFIPLPSRRTVGIIGFVGGVYLGTQISK